jgi:hypothetical protein
VRWDDWVELPVDSERKSRFLRNLLDEEPGSVLSDRAEEYGISLAQKLRKLRDVVAHMEAEKRRVHDESKIDFGL